MYPGERLCYKIHSYNKSQQDALFLNFIFIYNSTCFGHTYSPSSGVLILYSQKLVFVILKFKIGKFSSVYIAVNAVSRLLMMDSKGVRNM